MKILIGTLLFGLAAGAGAQAQPGTGTQSNHIDVAAGYTAARANFLGANGFWLQGGNLHVTGDIKNGFGVAADLTGLHAGSKSSSQAGLDLIALTFGPRYRWAAPVKGHDTAIFGHTLFGFGHGSNSVFPSLAGAKSSATSFALRMGGGVDVGLSNRFALRVVRIDWLRTQFPNGADNQQNHLEVGAGIVFHLR